MEDLRENLVQAALEWERVFGISPQITTVLSEFDAARLVGCNATAYSQAMRGATAVRRGYDFLFRGHRYQVKGNRPSGKPGSCVTWVPKASNYEWDYLVWVLYNTRYEVQEAWQWGVGAYREAFERVKRLSPEHMRRGTRLA